MAIRFWLHSVQSSSHSFLFSLHHHANVDGESIRTIFAPSAGALYVVEDRTPRVYPCMNEPTHKLALVYDVITCGRLRIELWLQEPWLYTGESMYDHLAGKEDEISIDNISSEKKEKGLHSSRPSSDHSLSEN